MNQDVKNITNFAATQLKEVGEGVLSSLFPNEFSYYMMALELTCDNSTIDFFTFPIMPNSISKEESQRISVSTSQSATHVLKNPAYMPKRISISGSFGKSFKFITSAGATKYAGGIYSGVGSWEDIQNKKVFNIPAFSVQYKNGYGCTKVLQSIVDKYRGSGKDGKEFQMNLYNMALGESYVVVPTTKPLKISQTQEKNMIWSYALSFDIVAPLELNNLRGGKAGDVLQYLSTGAVQSGVNTQANELNLKLSKLVGELI